MPLFPVHSTATAPPASVPVLEEVARRWHLVPNLLATLAESPAALQAYVTLHDAFAGAGLTVVERELVALAASVENGCGYCVAVHSASARGAGAPPEIVEAVRDGGGIASGDGEARLLALAGFATAVVAARGHVGDDLEAFLDAGFTPANVLEVIVGVALKTISNYTDHVAHVPLDAAFAAHAWERPVR